MKNYYRVLQVSDDAEPDVIRRAFETLTNPDKGSDRREIYEAFEVLSNPEKRKNYDRSMARALGMQRLLQLLTVAGILALALGWRLAISPAAKVSDTATPLRPVTLASATLSSTPDLVAVTLSPVPTTPDLVPTTPELVPTTPDVVPKTPVPQPAPGTTFYFEDFSSVQRGYLPKNWTGGEKLVVDEVNGKKFARPFERPSGGHSVVVNDVIFPANFEFELLVTLSGSGGAVCTVGSIKGGLLTSYEATLNDSKLSLDTDKKTTKISIRRMGPVVQLFLDGKEVLIGRYAQDAAIPTSFSLELAPSTIVHSIKGTAL